MCLFALWRVMDSQYLVTHTAFPCEPFRKLLIWNIFYFYHKKFIVPKARKYQCPNIFLSKYDIMKTSIARCIVIHISPYRFPQYSRAEWKQPPTKYRLLSSLCPCKKIQQQKYDSQLSSLVTFLQNSDSFF